jgi:hypothetical protein
MKSFRPARTASFLLTLAVGIALATGGCGSGGDGTTVEVSKEAQQKTQDMLTNISKQMQEKNKAAGKVLRKRF